MARTEKRLPTYDETSGNLTLDHVPDYKASHPRHCTGCGKGSRMRRLLRSKPRRREAKQQIKRALAAE